jgi:hypothetical protein
MDYKCCRNAKSNQRLENTKKRIQKSKHNRVKCRRMMRRFVVLGMKEGMVEKVEKEEKIEIRQANKGRLISSLDLK